MCRQQTEGVELKAEARFILKTIYLINNRLADQIRVQHHQQIKKKLDIVSMHSIFVGKSNKAFLFHWHCVSVQTIGHF